MDRSPNEIYRMLERLVARQYVMRNAGGDRYAISLKLFAMAHMHPPLNRLVNQALPVMDEFTRRAEQSCQMGVYDLGNVLIAAQNTSARGLARYRFVPCPAGLCRYARARYGFAR